LLTTSSERLVAAIPFMGAAVVVLLGFVVSGVLQKRAGEAQKRLFGKIEDEGGHALGLPSVTEQHFEAAWGWAGDVAAAFASVLSQVFAVGLLFHEAGSRSALPYLSLAVVVVMFLWFARLSAEEPTTHRLSWRAKLSPFQLSLVVSNLALAALILIFGASSAAAKRPPTKHTVACPHGSASWPSQSSSRQQEERLWPDHQQTACGARRSHPKVVPNSHDGGDDKRRHRRDHGRYDGDREHHPPCRARRGTHRTTGRR
jgi:hypothetical protein